MGRLLGPGAGGGGTTGVGGTTGGGGGGVVGPGIGGLVTAGRTGGVVVVALLPEPAGAPSSTEIVGAGVGLLVVIKHPPMEADATMVTTIGEANVRRGARADMR